MGSRRNNRKRVVGKRNNRNKGFDKDNLENPELQEKKSKKSNKQKVSFLNQKEVIEIIDHVLQGLKTNSHGLNIGEIKREHKVVIYKLYEDLINNPLHEKTLKKTGHSEFIIADVIVDYIKAKNQPIDTILKNLSKKEIDIINKLIFKKCYSD
jgi:hypothetical protein